MNKGPVIFIAEKGSEEIFKVLFLRGERIELMRMRAASEGAGDYPADLIVIDSGIYPERGLRLLRQLKLQRPEIPVIFISDDCFQNALEAFRAGARQYFCKPVNIFELQDAAETILAIKRSGNARREPVLLSQPEVDDPLSVATSDKPLPILRIIQYIEDNISDPITLEMLAAEASLSKFHFCRYFYRYTGMTPMKFVNFIRIEKVKELLRKKDIPISRLALYAGFNNLTTFNKQFKKFTGLSPAAYVETLKEPAEAQ